MSTGTTQHIRKFSAVLAGLGVTRGAEIVGALGLESELGQIEKLKALAAGERQRLGELLQTAQRLTPAQLQHALAEQRQSGKQIGSILVEQGLINARESEFVLAFQRSQCAHGFGKLQLGKVLVAKGDITRSQLARALQWQSVRGGRLGEALIASGLMTEHQIRNGLQLQRQLVAAALLTALALVAAFAPTAAHASSLMAGVQMSAVVNASAQLRTDFQAQRVTVTAADITRGYVVIQDASRFTVVTPKGGNYFVDFHVRGDLFTSVRIEGLGSEVEIGLDGGSVAQSGPGLKGATSTLNYRFQLNENVQAGDYDWPLMLAVRAR